MFKFTMFWLFVYRWTTRLFALIFHGDKLCCNEHLSLNHTRVFLYTKLLSDFVISKVLKEELQCKKLQTFKNLDTDGQTLSQTQKDLLAARGVPSPGAGLLSRRAQCGRDSCPYVCLFRMTAL